MRQAVVDLASQPITNLSWNPRATRFSIAEAKQPSFWNNRWGAFTSYSLITGATDGPAGITTYARATVTGTQAGIGFHLADNPEVGSPTGILLAPAVPGETVTLSLWVRSSVAVSINLQFRPGTGGAWAAAASTTLAPVSAGAWQRISKTYTVPAGTITGLGAYATFAGTAPPVGTTLDVTGMVYTRGGSIHPPDFVDGDYPGWRWLGAAGVSPSVGYPYTLESIAGSPPIVLNGSGAAPRDLTLLPALSGRTTYVVTDRVQTGSPSQAVFVNTVQSTVNQSGQIRLNTTSGNYEFRPQFVGGGGAGGVYASGATVIPVAGSRNVICVAQADGLAAHDLEINGGINASERASRSGMTVGSGYSDSATPGPTTTVATAAGYFETPLITYQFVGYHNQETRRRVTAWLARKYGSPIPAGY